ncbi:hypothetical protein A946_08175 [Methylacidiphilum kamchatkense Kam1]|uniref:Epoxyqueuosine reductase QueH n=1 Tax=Methylacidiphilum kamchatkense Kam1 TaxID=1202785 RepID=A0A0C1UQM0_9BACT|nr:epoxyqueuosine reductase QueH [Methylacidiphilum kamchatkense]KIE58158.1 hypothetical protein A946_08175 [Methylacidiphilum kamchatkense Kam1]QDQ42149.1 hypothetical protein kam1_910 [Methylacidiphilum kamchatkense Kam1]
MKNSFIREKLVPPGGVDKVLLHSCCAPCSAEIMDAIIASGIHLTVFFYNPNIHPRVEYEIRKNENIRFAKKRGIEFVDADYDKDRWFERVKGLEWEPERGKRCTVCFDMRMERTALYAYEHGFKVFSSSLGISRWKDFDQVTSAGIRAASRYGLEYWSYNWRKKGGSERMILISKEENFYQQLYCGCIYSLRDTNQWRLSKGKPKITFGKTFYGFDAEDSNSASSNLHPPS